MTAPFWMRGALKWTFFSLKVVGPDWSKRPSCTSLLFQFQLQRFYYFKTLCARNYGYSRCATDKPVTGRSSEGPVLWRIRKTLDIRHSTSVAFTDVESFKLSDKRAREDRWGRQETTYSSILCLLIFSRSPSRDPEIDRSASRWRMSQFQKCIWRTQEGESLVAVTVSDVSVHDLWKTQIKAWKQHFVFCHERRVNTNSSLFLKPQISFWHSSPGVVPQISPSRTLGPTPPTSLWPL